MKLKIFVSYTLSGTMKDASAKMKALLIPT